MLSEQEEPRFLYARFIVTLFRMMQTVRIHKNNNQLIKQCTTHFVEAEKRILYDDKLSLQISQDRLYIQGEKLHERKGNILAIKDFTEFLKQRGITRVIFHPAIRKAPHQQLVLFVRIMFESIRYDTPGDWITQKLHDEALSWVEVFTDGGGGSQDTEVRHHRDQAIATYTQAQSSLKEIVQKLTLQSYAGIRKVKRMMHNMATLIQEDETLFLGLSTIRDYDDYTYTHSVNVAILAICLGNRIGLSPQALSHLGICGLFHDLGKVAVPIDILNKPSKLSDPEWDEMRKHPLLSVRQILNLHTSHTLKSKIILAPFEHHLKYDLSGYPHTHSKRTVSLFGRILQIADYYDAITSPRAYRNYAYSPDQALALMMNSAGKEFDPLLLKIFYALLGKFPVGTLLLLNTGEKGIVKSYTCIGERVSLKIVLISKDEQGALVKGPVVELDGGDTAHGLCDRTIARALNPAAYGIKPADIIV